MWGRSSCLDKLLDCCSLLFLIYLFMSRTSWITLRIWLTKIWVRDTHPVTTWSITHKHVYSQPWTWQETSSNETSNPIQTSNLPPNERMVPLPREIQHRGRQSHSGFHCLWMSRTCKLITQIAQVCQELRAMVKRNYPIKTSHSPLGTNRTNKGHPPDRYGKDETVI